MSFSALPAEIILESGAELDLDGLSSLLRTSKWYSALLTPLLYDRGFDFVGTEKKKKKWIDDARERKEEEYVLADSKTPDFGPLSLIWTSASTWKSEFIVDYLLANVDTVFTNVNIHDSTELSLLSSMISQRNVAIVELLLARADVRDKYLEMIDGTGYTPLITAVYSGNITLVQMLLDAGADAIRSAPLTYAASCSSLEIVGRLIRAVKVVGGDMSPATLYSKSTPLHFAASKGTLGFVELLVEAGPDIWAKNSIGMMPVHLAASAVKPVVGLVELLLEEMRRRDDKNELDWKTQLLQLVIRKPGYLDVVRLLVAENANVFAADSNGNTTIGAVRAWNVWEEAQGAACILLNADPHIWPQGHINRRLWEIAREGEVEESQLILFDGLIKTGKSALEFDDIDRRRHTALHLLCDSIASDKSRGPILKMVGLLLEHGASVSAQGKWGETPILCAVRAKQTEALRLLLQTKPHDGVVDMPTIVPSGRVPLHEAAESGNATAVKLLIDAGANVLATDYRHRTALHLAAKPRDPDEMETVMRLLIDAGCPASAATLTKETALHVAVQSAELFRPFFPPTKLLLDAGCPATARDRAGQTVLNLATELSLPVAEELIRLAGAELVFKSDDGSGKLVCEALDLVATVGGPQNVARLLVSHGTSIDMSCEVCRKFMEELRR